MNIAELFGHQSMTESEKKAAVMNVFSVMMADGNIDPRELAVLAAVCKRIGITQQEMDTIAKNPQSIRFVRPRSEMERRAQLVDMVFMMMADGRIDGAELDIVAKLGVALGFNPADIKAVIQNFIVNALQTNKSRDEIIVDSRWGQEK